MHQTETNMNMMKLKAIMRDEEPPNDDYIFTQHTYSIKTHSK